TSKGATRLANTVFNQSGEAPGIVSKAYTDRNARTGARFSNAAGDLADVPSRHNFNKFYEGYRSAKGSELYDPVLRGDAKVVVSDDMTKLMERPSIQRALKTVDAWAAEDGVKLTEAERLYMVKRALNEETDAAFRSGKPINRTMKGNTS
ncbi:hypothetical protein, partial [Salmonella enterica]|uniref:hypothetical protein n=1 Tax=Salmonella enterica TaxID=28901 RepID=UPI001593080B